MQVLQKIFATAVGQAMIQQHQVVAMIIYRLNEIKGGGNPVQRIADAPRCLRTASLNSRSASTRSKRMASVLCDDG